MNNTSPGQPFPSPYAPPKKPFPVVLVVLGVIGLLLILAVFGGIKAFHAMQSGSSEATAIGDRFVDEMGRHNYAAAQAEFTPEVRAKTPAGNMKDIETLVEKHHGTYVAHGKPQWNMQNWNGKTSVRLVYPAQFAKSGSPITLTLVQTTKGYQVYDAHYEL